MRGDDLVRMAGVEVVDRYGEPVGTLRRVVKDPAGDARRWAVVSARRRHQLLVPTTLLYRTCDDAVATTLTLEDLRDAPRLAGSDRGTDDTLDDEVAFRARLYYE